MELQTYTKERGAAARLARDLDVSPVLVSQWANGTRPVPEDRAPAIEAATRFTVSVEELCPLSCWVRVPDPNWPSGKPLLDKTPAAAPTAQEVAHG